MFYEFVVTKDRYPNFHGKAIAEIINKKDIDETKDYDKEYLFLKYLDSENKSKNEFILKDQSKTIYPLNVRQGDNDDQINRVYLSGGTLSGKSYLAARLARDYKIQYPKRNIVLYSYIEDDVAYKGLNIKKIRIDESLLDDPMDIQELSNSLVIFDDAEAFSDKDILNELERIRNACVNTGRHYNIDTIICRQNMLESHKTKSILNSCFNIVGFPHSSSRYQFSQWLDRYLRLPKSIIQRILALPSRYVLINITTPMYILYARGAFIL